MGATSIRFVSVATLAVYLTVNVAVGAVHHHTDCCAHDVSALAVGTETGLIVTSAPAGDTDPCACLICKVLHQFTTFTSPVHAVVVSNNCSDAALLMPLPPISAFHSSMRPRAPPLV